MTELTVTIGDDGLTVLEFLQQQIPAAPAAYLRQLTRSGRLLLNYQATSDQALLHSGDTLRLPASQRLTQLLEQSKHEQIQILLEGPDFLAIYKPAGLAVHRGAGHEQDNLNQRVGNWLHRRKRPYSAVPVHRLDVGTSGPVLFAKGRRAASLLGKLLMAGQVEKHYLALVVGEVAETGELQTPVPAKGKLRAAATRYRRLSGNGSYSLLQLELLSGRKHQIRRQLADAGHPLIGDRRYGGPVLPDSQRLFLHCCTLSWPDPSGARGQTVNCPLPKDLQALLAAVELTLPAASIY
ncbi:MAG: RluA family pseudouridine synthase [Syntrophotaleaceae bacterium]